MWILVGGVVVIIVLLLVYFKSRKGVEFVEKPSLRSLAGCGRKLIKKIAEKIGGC